MCPVKREAEETFSRCFSVIRLKNPGTRTIETEWQRNLPVEMGAMWGSGPGKTQQSVVSYWESTAPLVEYPSLRSEMRTGTKILFHPFIAI